MRFCRNIILCPNAAKAVTSRQKLVFGAQFLWLMVVSYLLPVRLIPPGRVFLFPSAVAVTCEGRSAMLPQLFQLPEVLS